MLNITFFINFKQNITQKLSKKTVKIHLFLRISIVFYIFWYQRVPDIFIVCSECQIKSISQHNTKILR